MSRVPCSGGIPYRVLSSQGGKNSSEGFDRQGARVDVEEGQGFEQRRVLRARVVSSTGQGSEESRGPCTGGVLRKVRV